MQISLINNIFIEFEEPILEEKAMVDDVVTVTIEEA